MNLLFIRHKVRDGYEKVYRFSADRGSLNFGSSRKADVRLPKSVASAIEGSLQFEQGAWVYHSFSMKENEPLIIPLKEQGQFRIGSHEFSTEVIEQKSLFNEELSQGDLGDQLVLIMLNGHIFKTYKTKPGQTLNIEEAGERLTIHTRESRNWITEVQGSFEIRQRTVIKTSSKEMLRSWSEALHMSRQDRIMLGSVALILLLGMISLVVKPKETPEVALNEPPKVSAPITIKVVAPTERRRQEPQAQAKKENAATPRMNNIQNLSQNIANRAGKFLKKSFSNAAAIGMNGTVNAPAVGVSRLSGPATDWNAAAGENVSGKVSGGLGGTGGTSRLSGGSVGNSGVNLLDTESEVTGGLDKEVIADFIRRNIGHILYCYERSLSANPNLFGKVSVRFTIGASGQVETQKIGESTLREAKVESCILDKISQWKFPTPKGGVQVAVTYPFLFKTTN